MSEFSRETLLNIIETDHVQCGEASALARIALAAMDSEPVGYFGRFDPDDEDLIDQCSKNVKGAFPLYRHAQPAPVVPDDVLKALQKVARLRLDLNDFDGDRRGIADCLCDAEEALIEVVNRRAAMLHAGNSPAQSDHCPAQNCIHSAQGVDRPIAWHHTAKSKEENHSTCCFSYAPSHDFGPWYEKPQSQPHYLPEELDYDRALHFLSTEPRKATPETVIGGNSPAQNYASPAQNSVNPEQSPIDHGYRPECECSGCKATARICAELSANSSANPDCWCRTCRPVVLNDMRFVVCPDCGNKRCPRANDHRNACTGSNEPGQEGGAYSDTPQEVKP
ncbi:hypothetical protein [Klebsiella quasipneumoniae]|uniref:hypothetical protein n=1 Tax=Klebsiella quasipneumoniae TaxID=1463165 RepID=UPI00247FA560|nr:hypothetical protein [Klebsiella quasipneumoniae]